MKSVILLCFAIAWMNDIFMREKFETGFYKVRNSNSDIFYWLFHARDASRADPPLIMWFNGGPGCSSMYAALAENGPFYVSATLPANLTLNPYSWNSRYDVIYVDSPSGVGFSLLDEEACVDTNCFAKDVYVFLCKFMAGHPQYQTRDFYISGESYAGHYIPKLGEYIIKQHSSLINLRGVAIGNGWYVGNTQMMGYSIYAHENNLIGFWRYALSSLIFYISKLLIEVGLSNIGGYLCDETGLNVIGIDNVYDIRNMTVDYDPSVLEFLRRADVAAILNATNRPYSNGMPDSCNETMYFTYQDSQESMEGPIRTMIDANVKVLLYTGDQDFICNVKTQEMWIEQMQWNGAEAMKQTYTEWMLGNTSYGKYRYYKNFMHLVIYNASHMVPTDQRYASQMMIEQLIDSKIK
jgi:cathepsin A (carboxypeptidase C)